eukprot:m.46139 g.46139  ORF g.46139 m.46139 type:complete len:462 (+) comp13120_c0_seq1:191-1576(+)
MPALNLAIAGKHIALLPHCEQFVNLRHKWMQSQENRLKRGSKPPSFDEEMQVWETWSKDKTSFGFMIADMDKWMQQDEQLISCLVGEVILTLTQEKDFAFAMLDVLMIDSSVRRRAMLSEAMVFALQFAYSSLKADFIIVHPGNPSPTRLTFTARDDAVEEPVRRMSITQRVSSGMTLLRNAARGATIKAKSDVLQRLTKNLHRQDHNDHWPEQLDFYLTEEDDLVLDFTSDTMKQLDYWSGHAQFFKFSSIDPDRRLRLAGHTRLNGKTLTLLPYLSQHVKRCHAIMQHPSAHKAFGIAPPTLEEEGMAQHRLEGDAACYAFVVALQEKPGIPSCPVSIVGRAQIMFEAGQAKLYIGLAEMDPALQSAAVRESFVLLLYFVYAATLTKRVVLPSGLDPRAGADDSRWDALCQFESVAGTDEWCLDLSRPEVKAALLKLSKKAEMEGFDANAVKYQSASSV